MFSSLLQGAGSVKPKYVYKTVDDLKVGIYSRGVCSGLLHDIVLAALCIQVCVIYVGVFYAQQSGKVYQKSSSKSGKGMKVKIVTFTVMSNVHSLTLLTVRVLYALYSLW